MGSSKTTGSTLVLIFNIKPDKDLMLQARLGQYLLLKHMNLPET